MGVSASSVAALSNSEDAAEAFTAQDPETVISSHLPDASYIDTYFYILQFASIKAVL